MKMSRFDTKAKDAGAFIQKVFLCVDAINIGHSADDQLISRNGRIKKGKLEQ